MLTLRAIFIGMLAGLHTSTWGMYKDAPHEGFGWPKYFRSAFIGGIVGLALYRFAGLDLHRAAGGAVFFGTVYVIERALVEFYKTFLRVEDQSKYFIPMQFAVFGKVVESRAKQLTVGAAYAIVVLVIGYGLWQLQLNGPELPGWLVVVTIGAVGGWLSAFGGAWKDAPKEGFQTLKFFRSPLLAAAWAWLLAHLTTSYLLLAMAALGYTIATTETYKTFFFPSKPRGKFAGMPIVHPEMLRKRQYFVPIYVAIWVIVLITFYVALTGQNEGLL